MSSTTNTTAAAGVSANFNDAGTAGLARTNQYLCGLLDSLVAGAGGGPDENPRFAEQANKVSIHHVGDREDKEGFGNSVGGSGAEFPRRDRRRKSRRFSEQCENTEVLPTGAGAVEPSASGLSRAVRSLVDALQERDGRIEGLEDELRLARERGDAAVEMQEAALEKEAAKATALRAEVTREKMTLIF